MRRWIGSLLVMLLVLLAALPASAADGPMVPTSPKLPGGTLPRLELPNLRNSDTPVAFSAIANRYTNLDPATIVDLNGDLTGDLQVTNNTVTAKNGAKVQLLEPAVLNLDEVQAVPTSGYAATAAVQLSRVYVAQLAGGGYAKFMLLQASPKVTVWFHFGTPTTSRLTLDGSGGTAVLSWDALPDAQLGYNIYRYEILEGNAYSVTLLNDFTVRETTFADTTSKNRYYLWVVIAIKENGAFGNSTTVAAGAVQAQQRSLVISLEPAAAKLNGANVVVPKAPVIRGGRLMVPASILTSAGVTVNFDAGPGKVTLSRRIDTVTYTLVMTVDSTQYTWNGASYEADVAPYKNGNEVMVPLRVVAPALGFGTTFNSEDRTATIQWYE
ncbi:MAG TPA: copper amine oxidase N-terminal domain-containing protein [Symbiobacteriaceae bacterium]|nr:copper amine oxidase N-terminal domain-containing protein [Symbiobacteriaceae bacterium]